MAGFSPITEVLARINNAGMIWYACFDYVTKLLKQQQAVEHAVLAQIEVLHAQTAELRALRMAVEQLPAEHRAIAEQKLVELTLPVTQSIQAFHELSAHVQSVRQDLTELRTPIRARQIGDSPPSNERTGRA